MSKNTMTDFKIRYIQKRSMGRIEWDEHGCRILPTTWYWTVGWYFRYYFRKLIWLPIRRLFL